MSECEHRVNGVCSFCGRASGAIVQELQAKLDELMRDIDVMSRPHVARIVEQTLAGFRGGTESQLASVTKERDTLSSLMSEVLDWAVSNRDTKSAFVRSYTYSMGVIPDVLQRALAAIRSQEEKTSGSGNDIAGR
jgi:hypothetical protein